MNHSFDFKPSASRRAVLAIGAVGLVTEVFPPAAPDGAPVQYAMARCYLHHRARGGHRG